MNIRFCWRYEPPPPLKDTLRGGGGGRSCAAVKGAMSLMVHALGHLHCAALLCLRGTGTAASSASRMGQPWSGRGGPERDVRSGPGRGAERGVVSRSEAAAVCYKWRLAVGERAAAAAAAGGGWVSHAAGCWCDVLGTLLNVVVVGCLCAGPPTGRTASTPRAGRLENN